MLQFFAHIIHHSESQIHADQFDMDKREVRRKSVGTLEIGNGQFVFILMGVDRSQFQIDL